jgi:hypothetical protein
MPIISDMIREIREQKEKIAEQKKKIAVQEEQKKEIKEKIAVLEEEARQMRRWCGIAEEQKEEIAVLEEEARQGRAKEMTWTKGQEDYPARLACNAEPKGQEDNPVAVWGKEQEPKEPDRLAEMVRRRPWRFNGGKGGRDEDGEFTSCDCGDDYAICQDCNSPKCTCCGLCECSFECKCFQHLRETRDHETKCLWGNCNGGMTG